MPRKWLDHSIVLEIFYLLLPFYTYTRAKFVLPWNTVVTYGLWLSHPIWLPQPIWAGSSHRSLSALDSVQHRLKGLVGPELYSTLQPLSHRRNVASISLFYRYIYGKCSTELHSLVPPLRVFRRQTRYSNDCAKHPFLLQILKSHHKFHESSFFPRNSLPPEAFPDNYNINKFKSNANKCK